MEYEYFVDSVAEATDKNERKNHSNRKNTKEELFACEQCNKTFEVRGNLQRHVKVVHERIRPYACDHCDKRFSSSSNLKYHLHTHTKVRPYSCNPCNRTFTHLSALRTHKINVHQGSHACDHCDKRFSTDSLLKRHIEKDEHTGQINRPSVHK